MLQQDLTTTIAEHNVKIANLESLVRDTNNKLSELLSEFQQLQISLAQSGNTNNDLISALEPRVDNLDKKVEDLIATKNQVIGAITLSGIIGAVLGGVGTWAVELFRK